VADLFSFPRMAFSANSNLLRGAVIPYLPITLVIGINPPHLDARISIIFSRYLKHAVRFGNIPTVTHWAA
jgi:hypothetical protein